MEMRKELEVRTRFLPLETLLDKVAIPKEFLPEEVKYILPSIRVGSDGLVLERILLVSESYICDVRLDAGKTEFDFIAKDSVSYSHFQLWTHEVKEGDLVKASYEIARISFRHHSAFEIGTGLNYAGSERGKWLKKVVEALPVRLVL